MKIIVKSHKRNGRIVKSHSRKIVKKRVGMRNTPDSSDALTVLHDGKGIKALSAYGSNNIGRLKSVSKNDLGALKTRIRTSSAGNSYAPGYVGINKRVKRNPTIPKKK